MNLPESWGILFLFEVAICCLSSLFFSSFPFCNHIYLKVGEKQNEIFKMEYHVDFEGVKSMKAIFIIKIETTKAHLHS